MAAVPPVQRAEGAPFPLDDIDPDTAMDIRKFWGDGDIDVTNIHVHRHETNPANDPFCGPASEETITVTHHTSDGPRPHTIVKFSCDMQEGDACDLECRRFEGPHSVCWGECSVILVPIEGSGTGGRPPREDPGCECLCHCIGSIELPVGEGWEWVFLGMAVAALVIIAKRPIPITTFRPGEPPPPPIEVPVRPRPINVPSPEPEPVGAPGGVPTDHPGGGHEFSPRLTSVAEKLDRRLQALFGIGVVGTESNLDKFLVGQSSNYAYLGATFGNIASPWLRVRGDFIRATVELIAASLIGVKVNLYTKNENQVGPGQSVDSTQAITLSSPSRVTTEWGSNTGIGLKQLVRFVFSPYIATPPTPANGWCVFRMLPSVWFDAVLAPPLV